jgi:Spy/CpxP family protein refolding chaperone
MSWQGWNRRSLSLLLIASLAFNVGVGATFGALAYKKHSASDVRGDRRGGPGRFGALERLNLTPDQETQITEAREKMIELVRELRQELKQENRVLTELMVAPEPDREAITVQLSRVASLREQMDRHVVEHFLNTKQLLAPDQHEAFNEMICRAFSRGGPGRGGHGGPRGLHDRPGRGRRGRSPLGDD